MTLISQWRISFLSLSIALSFTCPYLRLPRLLAPYIPTLMPRALLPTAVCKRSNWLRRTGGLRHDRKSRQTRAGFSQGCRHRRRRCNCCDHLKGQGSPAGEVEYRALRSEACSLARKQASKQASKQAASKQAKQSKAKSRRRRHSLILFKCACSRCFLAIRSAQPERISTPRQT